MTEGKFEYGGKVMNESDDAEKNGETQTDVSYGDFGTDYVNRDSAQYNYDRRNDNNMADRDYGNQNYNAGPVPQANYQPNYPNPMQGNYRGNYGGGNYGGGNYGGGNYGGGIFGRRNYVGAGNYRGNYNANYAQSGMRGYPGSYPYNAGYGRAYDNNYEYDYDHDDHDDHDDYDDYDDKPGYYGYGPYYNRPPGMGRNWMYHRYNYGPIHSRPPGMGRNWMYHQYYHGQPYFDGYGMPGQGPLGFVRNWFAYNPVTNWVRSPRGSNFLRGLGIATAGIILAPAVVKTLRPLAVQAVHGVMSIAGEVKGVVADAREELEDIFADAKWENLGEREEKIQEGQ